MEISLLQKSSRGDARGITESEIDNICRYIMLGYNKLGIHKLVETEDLLHNLYNSCRVKT